MIKKSLLPLCGLLALAVSQSAQAKTMGTEPAGINAAGDVTLVYIGSDAGDSSTLSVTGGATDVFCNRCSGTSVGATLDLGNVSGPLNFQLHDTSVANVFDTGTLASDGKYHATLQSNYADLGLAAMPDAALSVITSLTTDTSVVSYIAFEDRIGGDYDYNDFVIAVISTPSSDGVSEIDTFGQDPVTQIDPDAPETPAPSFRLFAAVAPVPEPASLAVFGAGLLGFAGKRRRS
jgi:hypothetical protein